jgi:hypothetical protein
MTINRFEYLNLSKNSYFILRLSRHHLPGLWGCYLPAEKALTDKQPGKNNKVKKENYKLGKNGGRNLPVGSDDHIDRIIPAGDGLRRFI